jgi:hypothetical protein
MNKNDIKNFLAEFKANMSAFGVIYANRDKNIQTLADLEITPKFRDNVLSKLIIEDYCLGPLTNDQFGTNPMWVFGVNVKNKRFTLKLQYCQQNHFVFHSIFQIIP